MYTFAQELEVKSFTYSPFDLSAKVKPQLDYSGKQCALIKIHTSDNLLEVQGNIIGKVSHIGMEWWAYVTDGTKHIQLIFEKHLPLFIKFSDFDYPSLSEGATYVMKLDEMTMLSTRQSGNVDVRLVRQKGIEAYNDSLSQQALDLFMTIPDDAVAQTYIGHIYGEGRNGEKSIDKAISWFKKAAEQGNAEAQYQLGGIYCLLEGYKNLEEGVKWLGRSAENGYADAQYLLGWYLYSKPNPNYSDSIYWMRMAAQNGNATGKFLTGIMYLNGQGVSKNEAEGMRWLEDAAANGANDALKFIGIAYKYGAWGYKKNKSKAKEYLQEAVNKGVKDAFEELNNL